VGGIPAELGQLSALEFLDLQSNHLSGTVPALPALLQQDARHEVPLIRRLR
jgi:Leucine-rich repeat (LRR) protein